MKLFGHTTVVHMVFRTTEVCGIHKIINTNNKENINGK
jgi:hypothetical protein